MKPLLSPGEAAALDGALRGDGVAAADLMERAGAAVARATLDLLGGAYGRRVVVVCGSGNNGGDGYVAARHLARAGVKVAVVDVGAPVPGGEAARNRDRLGEVGAAPAVFELTAVVRELRRADAVIDAIVGIGACGPLREPAAAAVGAIVQAGIPVVSVDVPSGVDVATGAVAGTAVRATLTVTFWAAKTGTVLLPGAEMAGEMRVVDLGWPDTFAIPRTAIAEPADVVTTLPARPIDGHKRASGVVLVAAGSRDMPGAPRLAARAAARAGAGLVIVATPVSALPVALAGVPEAVGLALPEGHDGRVGAGALDLVLERAGGAHAVVVGPGLGGGGDVTGFVRGLVGDCTVPLVLDADGLNAFAGDVASLAERKEATVATPHLGELRRLVENVEADRLAAARDLARAGDAIALVKGTRTVIADPEGNAVVNPTGTPALATAGTGDVLAGVIGGLLARGVAAFEAAWAGAYLHGLAGTIAGNERGDGAVAWDVAEALPAAVAGVRRQAERAHLGGVRTDGGGDR